MLTTIVPINRRPSHPITVIAAVFAGKSGATGVAASYWKRPRRWDRVLRRVGVEGLSLAGVRVSVGSGCYFSKLWRRGGRDIQDVVI